MDEQGFSKEFDSIDDTAWHIVLFDKDNPVAACRVFYDEKEQCYVIGRVAVSKEYRGQGIGNKMLTKAEELVKSKNGKKIKLSAQARVEKFYTKQGYIKTGKEYLDEGCPHIELIKNLQDNIEFREMRRKRQLLSDEEVHKILIKGTSGVLAVWGDNDYPYAVPLSYVYHNSKIYFHCAKTGHKIDGIKRNSKVSFCVVNQDIVKPQEYTTYFRSVIAFGSARIMENESEIKEAANALVIKYAPMQSEADRQIVIEEAYERLCMVEINIHHITGKEAIELVKER